MHTITTASSVDVGEVGAPAAVLPVGSFEQHGKHLPLATDTLVACCIASAIADRYRLFLLPPITISCSHEHARWPGTVSISAATLMAVIRDVRQSLEQAGIDKLVIVNGHGGNYILANVTQEANVSGPHVTLYPGRTEWDTARHDAGLESSGHDDMHGGEIETSLLLHAYPHVVGDRSAADVVAGPRPHLLIYGMNAYTTSGILGSPSLGTAEKGRLVLESLTHSFRTHMNALGLVPIEEPGGSMG